MRNGSKRQTEKAAADSLVKSVTGSGNVFADLGIPNPDLALAKARLVQRVRDIIVDRGLTQAQAAELLGLDQPKVSTLVRGRVDGYSLERLFRFLNVLGQDVEITVRESRRRGNRSAGVRRGTLVAR
jgi:predicted XRE-type DNA-binding protein